MQRKKILFLITKATWGGAQRYVFDLATHLPKNEFEPVVAYGQSGKLSNDLANAGVETIQVTSLQRDVALFSDIASFFAILKCIRATKPDIIHLNSSKAAALGALAARIVGVSKIIFTVHGWPFNEKRSEFARIVIYLISWFTALLSHEVIVVSKSDEANGKDMRWVGNKIHYISIGIESPHFLPRDEAWQRLLEKAPTLSSTGMRVVTIAELTANKGLRYGIEAIGELISRGINCSYTIIGTGEDFAGLSALIRDQNLADNVHLVGFIPDAASYLNVFDVFLLPSVKEGMPYVLLEAASSGLPIVTTTAVDVELPRCRIVPIQDTDALVEALMESKNKGALEIQHRYSLSEMVGKTIGLY